MRPASLAPGAFHVRPVRLDTAALLRLHARNPARYPVLLESAATGSLGRHDVLLACPAEQLLLDGQGRLSTNAALSPEGTFLETLDQWWKACKQPATDTPLPFTGGWFLFLGYELAREIEPSLKDLPRAAGTVAMAVRMPAAVVHSHATGEGWLVAEAGYEECLDLLSADLDSSSQPLAAAAGEILDGPVREEPAGEFLHAVGRALEHIAAGDIYQANLSRAWSAALKAGVAPHDVYHRLRLANPGPFAGLAVWNDQAIISSSPERLLSVRHGRISTRPIAGTRPRSSNPLADRSLARELRQNRKEQAEHVMLIDLERNDLGRICEPGSVEVDEYMALESYAHVHHIVSNVRGRLRPEVTPGQAIAAVFPGGTITGCPKVRCMQIIGALESVPRGVYTGSMGYLNRDGSMDLNILIRTMSLHGRELSFRAGAGIVADSDPLRELEETRAKARGLLRALEEAA